MAYSLSNSCTKNYGNQTTTVEIIVEGWLVYTFCNTVQNCVTILALRRRFFYYTEGTQRTQFVLNPERISTNRKKYQCVYILYKLLYSCATVVTLRCPTMHLLQQDSRTFLNSRLERQAGISVRAFQFGQKSFDSIRFNSRYRIDFFDSILFGNLINLPLVH